MSKKEEEENRQMELRIVLALVPFVDKLGRKRIGAILMKLAAGMMK